MGNVVQFRLRPSLDHDDEIPEVDLVTAVDVAIRDLRDIARQSLASATREQANSCRLMLERAYEAAVRR
ncbi:hypothetical protein [Chelatococcus reniformis]|uniref:Uncharacterized protein n=1 Tax=Chelatococcus reniformis TaxID=1494448 RepID=A0A916XAE0_9HYPH|nr:hypothetical protein [Chelatococcus reniformis]GGC57328.1 hypothetical protein GCM10010994_15360 [Chelatococcus reniformis]